jgi:hypothetical protein
MLHDTRPKRLEKYKHSSLLGPFISHKFKKNVANTAPGVDITFTQLCVNLYNLFQVLTLAVSAMTNKKCSQTQMQLILLALRQQLEQTYPE